MAQPATEAAVRPTTLLQQLLLWTLPLAAAHCQLLHASLTLHARHQASAVTMHVFSGIMQSWVLLQWRP
jgi:hypothetical protein